MTYLFLWSSERECVSLAYRGNVNAPRPGVVWNTDGASVYG